MARDWDIVVVGGANTDYLVRGPRLPRSGETVEGDTFQIAPGGKGANQAVAAARLGARVAMVARVGDDEHGRELIRSLNAEGVDTQHVVRGQEAPTGAALVMVDQEGEKQILTAPGANRRLTASDVRAAADFISASKVVLMQLEVPTDAVLIAARLGREAGARVVLDPAPPAPLPDELFGLVDVIKPDAGEAEVLTGLRVQDRASARRAADQLLDRGVRTVAVQAGREGNLVVSREEELWLPKIPVESVDETGAGDAFAGVMAAAIASGESLTDAARLAHAAAALATTVLGAQASLPRREAVMALLKKI